MGTVFVLVFDENKGRGFDWLGGNGDTFIELELLVEAIDDKLIGARYVVCGGFIGLCGDDGQFSVFDEIFLDDKVIDGLVLPCGGTKGQCEHDE